MQLRPFAAAGVTAVVSTGLLAVAVARGWLGPDAGRGAQFCEAGRDWVVRQPANTFSNLGFVVAGLLIGWHAGHQDAGRRTRATALACLVVLLGPGSAAMHATQSVAGGQLDLLSMYLVAAFILAYAVTRWRRGGTRLLVAVFLAGVAVCEAAGAWDVTVPVVQHPGNAAFGALLVAAVTLEVAVMRRTTARRGYAYGAIASILAAFAIWNATQTWLCDPHSPVQGHAAWHLLCALSVYLLSRHYAEED